jgi:hypothetical protein
VPVADVDAQRITCGPNIQQPRHILGVAEQQCLQTCCCDMFAEGGALVLVALAGKADRIIDDERLVARRTRHRPQRIDGIRVQQLKLESHLVRQLLPECLIQSGVEPRIEAQFHSPLQMSTQPCTTLSGDRGNGIQQPRIDFFPRLLQISPIEKESRRVAQYDSHTG